MLKLSWSPDRQSGRVMEIESVRVESSVWVGNKRFRALLSGWYISWNELEKKNREKKTSK